VANALCVLTVGFLFVAAEGGNQYVTAQLVGRFDRICSTDAPQ